MFLGSFLPLRERIYKQTVMRSLALCFIATLFTLGLFAEEGMWLPNKLKQTCAVKMAAAGCKMSPEEIYSVNTPSLKDAIVRFGNGCTGEVVSADGLVFTNHHCGYEYVQALSSVEHDYLKDGFAALSRKEELPCVGLKVRFLQYLDDVSERILEGNTLSDDPKMREQEIATRIDALKKELKEKDAGLDYEIKPIYYGNQYYVYAYKTYTDVRLVVTPPSSVGKFGGDTDNWMWPRHTGDFTLFRIYANANNEPAEYSETNVPYHPRQFLKINVGGVKENEFVMVYGYPGTTQQYLTSAAVESIAMAEDPRKVALRRKRLDVMEQFMALNDTLRIQYSSKHANVANAWKKWIGEASGLERVDAVARKREQEKAFSAFANSSVERKAKYQDLLPALDKLYGELTPLVKANDMYTQGILGIESLAFAQQLVRLTQVARNEKRELAPDELKAVKMEASDYFKDYDRRVDLALAKAMLEVYLNENVGVERLASIQSAVRDTKGIERFQKKVMLRSMCTDAKKWEKALNGKHFLKQLANDPLFQFAETLANEYKQTVAEPLLALRTRTTDLYRRYVAGLMEMQPERVFFPDANSTLRLAYGKVEGYSPREGIQYTPFTSLDGVAEKVKMGAHDYVMPDRLKELYARKEYGRWAKNGSVPACFLASVHTTGGNSGSPTLNANGELVGLNFDRVWEGTMSDVMFDPVKCRNIVVDIRYVLFFIDQYAKAGYLLKEMSLVE